MEPIIFLKRTLLNSLLMICFLVMAVAAHGQQVLLADQNPGYMESMNHYLVQKDSLIKNEGTTAQQTYKAYQYFEAKRERKELRREWRQQRRMNYGIAYRNYFGHYSPYYNDPYPYYPRYRHDPYYSVNHRYNIRWSDVATATALGLSAYFLFR